MNSPLALAALSGFLLNLPVQMGLGLREIFLEREGSFLDALLESIILFISLMLQWIIFFYLLAPLSLVVFKYFLLLPLGAVTPSFLLMMFKKISPEKSAGKENVFLFSHKAGQSLAALLITLSLAGSFRDAFIITSGFSLGAFFAVSVLKAVRFRIERERISPLLRGLPLYLIVLAILSLVFSSIAIIFLR